MYELENVTANNVLNTYNNSRPGPLYFLALAMTRKTLTTLMIRSTLAPWMMEPSGRHDIRSNILVGARR